MRREVGAGPGGAPALRAFPVCSCRLVPHSLPPCLCSCRYTEEKPDGDEAEEGEDAAAAAAVAAALPAPAAAGDPAPEDTSAGAEEEEEITAAEGKKDK